jgi:hypothetical protein
LAFATVSWGQTGRIIHTICGPEYSFTVNYDHPAEGLVNLDYDQDGETDHYIFSEHVYSWGDCQIRIQGADGTGWRLKASPCTVGDTIACYADSLYYWPWYVLLRGWQYNYNSGASNVYANTYYSVRKPSAKGYLYAWWRISITWRNDEDVTLTVHEMAYCTEPGYPLRVGQTSYDWNVEVLDITPALTVHPNPTEGVFTVSGEDVREVEVYNALGQQILTQLVNGGTANIDLESQPAGVYFVNVTDQNGKRCVKKVVKR